MIRRHQGGIAVSILNYHVAPKYYPLKKVYTHQQDIIATNMNTHIIQ